MGNSNSNRRSVAWDLVTHTPNAHAPTINPGQYECTGGKNNEPLVCKLVPPKTPKKKK